MRYPIPKAPHRLPAGIRRLGRQALGVATLGVVGNGLDAAIQREPSFGVHNGLILISSRFQLVLFDRQLRYSAAPTANPRQSTPPPPADGT